MPTPNKSGIHLRPFDPKVFFAWFIMVLGVVNMLAHLIPGARSAPVLGDVAYGTLALLYWLEVAVGVSDD